MGSGNLRRNDEWPSSHCRAGCGVAGNWPWLAAAAVLIAGCGGSGGGDPVAATGSLGYDGCTIGEDNVSCLASISWQTTGATQPRLTLDGVELAAGPNGRIDTPVGGAFVELVLSDGLRELDELTVRGACETATAWDGASCRRYARRENLRIATSFVDNDEPVELELVTFEPLSPGPWPLVLFHHGSTGDGSDPSEFSRTFVSEFVAETFVELGYKVAFPQRRGRGGSDGLYDEGFRADRSGYSCARDETLPGVERALADLDAVLTWALNRADVDAERIVSAGTSRGGVLALLHAARHPAVIAGAVNFVGGWLAEGCGDHFAVNRGLFVDASAAATTLWLYAANDSFYSVAYSRAHFDAFVTAGGSGQFIDYRRAAGLNGHFLINDPALWQADVALWLSQIP